MQNRFLIIWETVFYCCESAALRMQKSTLRGCSTESLGWKNKKSRSVISDEPAFL